MTVFDTTPRVQYSRRKINMYTQQQLLASGRFFHTLNTTRSSTDWLSFSRSRGDMTHDPVDSCTVGALFAFTPEAHTDHRTSVEAKTTLWDTHA